MDPEGLIKWSSTSYDLAPLNPHIMEWEFYNKHSQLARTTPTNHKCVGKYNTRNYGKLKEEFEKGLYYCQKAGTSDVEHLIK